MQSRKLQEKHKREERNGLIMMAVLGVVMVAFAWFIATSEPPRATDQELQDYREKQVEELGLDEIPRW